MWVNEVHRRGSSVISMCATIDPGAVLEMPKWSWAQLGETELPVIWPLVSVGSEAVSREHWQRTTGIWLRENSRGLIAIQCGGGPALAAFLFEAEGPEGSRPCCFIVRLWVVEPGLPGRSLRACLTAAREFARTSSYHGVLLERAAIDPRLDAAHIDLCAGHCGYLSCRDGWYAPPAGIHDIVTFPKRRSRRA